MSKLILKTSSSLPTIIFVALISLSLVSNAAAQDQRRTLMDDNKSTEQTDNKPSTNSTKQSASTSTNSDSTQNAKDKSSIVGSGLGQQPAPATTKASWPQQSSPGAFELIYRPLGATLLICAFAIGFLKLYRRFGGNKGQKEAPLASILATLSLGDKRSLAVVKVGHEVLVLGNTPNAITLLTQMTEDFEPVTVTEQQPVRASKQKAQAVQPIEDFTKNLKEEMERKAQSRNTSEPQFARVRQSLLGIQ